MHADGGRTFAINTEPHIAHIGDTVLQFQPEVGGTEFLEHYARLRAEYKRLGIEGRLSRDKPEAAALADLRALRITTTALPDDAGPRLARLRAHTGARMLDCCVLLTSEQTAARVATFDTRLRKIAASVGSELAPA